MTSTAGFFTAPTLATLTGGAAGAIIAVTGAFLVAWWTVRLDRRRAADVDASEAQRRDRADRNEVAALFIGVLAALEAETRMAPLLAGRTQRVLLEAVIAGHRIAARDHPEVAAWLLDQFARFAELSHWSWRVLLGSRLSERHSAYAAQLALLIGHLQIWAIGERDDEWFATHRHSHLEPDGAIQ